MQVSKFEARRITRNYRQTINSTPDSIFPLICPVREAEWLDGWEYAMIYSQTGFAEEGAVFSTPSKGEEDTIWIVTKQDSINREIEFARVTPASRASMLKVTIRAKDKKSSYIDISYVYTGITPEGNKFVDSYTEAEFLEMVQLWEESVNYFLETGKKLVKHK